MIMYLQQIQIQIYWNTAHSAKEEEVIMNTETIRKRISVRTYEEKRIPEQVMQQVREYL